jgi:superfamily II DNA or RNA helicase
MAERARLSFDRGTLVLRGPDKAHPPGGLAEGIWQWDERVGQWRCEAIHYSQARDALRAVFGAAFKDVVREPLRVNWPEAKLPELRPEQVEALDSWRAAGRRGLVVMPTGTGKTEVALAAMAEAGVATLVVSPIRDLMYQWHRRILHGLGYDAGILGDRLVDVRPVTVTTYDSAYIHMPEIGDRFGLIVFDEVHHLPGKCRREAALFSTAPMRLGLTATPERADGLHADLEWLVGPVVYALPMARVRGRTLAEYDVVRVPVHLTDDEQDRYDRASATVRAYMAKRRRERPGYTWKDLCAETGRDPEARRAQKAYYAKKSVEDRAEEKLRVLEDIFRLHGERVIVFAGSNAMAMDVSRRFLVPTLLNHSRKRERQAVLDGFAAGRLPAVVANQVLDEGVDVPEAKVGVVIGGQSSTRQAKQRLGRILRKTGGAKATLYEVVCTDTREAERSRARRRTDAFADTPRRSLGRKTCG